MATTIDALGLAEDFEKAGFSRDQALGMARAIRDHASETLATKADLRELELRMEARFAQLEQKIAEAQTSMIKWFTGIMIAQGAAIVALIKLLP
ncbi:MAG TPA: hypothetical protein VHQ91_14705 [Geminicoccaceae bacterium]|jgi:hypothetical protein|nr:hypothetical protein [Geminicoccaceae bacterium]